MNASEPKRRLTPKRAESGKRRAGARNRALARLAQEFADRYRELYAEERGVAR